jgi:hypothetical protein
MLKSPFTPIAALALALGVTTSASAVVISNGIAVGTVGHWSVDVLTGGESRAANLTANRLVGSSPFTEDVLFDYFTYIGVGSGATNNFRLGNLASATPSGGAAVSNGTFTGSAGNTINWSVTSSIPASVSVMTSTYTFTAVQGTLGTLRLFQYMDEDIEAVSDDVFFTRGSVATSDLQLFTVDNTEVYGVSHSGALSALQGLVNASYIGCGVDQFDNMRPRLDGGTQNLADPCVIQNLVGLIHPIVGAAFGPADIVSVLAWQADPNATSATIITTLGGIPSATDIPPTQAPEPSGLALLGLGVALLALQRRFAQRR